MGDPRLSRHDLAGQLAGHAVLARLASSYDMRAQGAGSITDLGELVSWAVGYVGEAQVGAHLAGLGSQWRTLHAVPLGRRTKDLDHLVIGPGGVFAINTKHHAHARVTVRGGDALYVNGAWKPYLKDARRDAAETEDLLAAKHQGVPVRAVICLVGAHLKVIRQGDGVDVLDVGEFRDWLTARPQALTAEVIDELFTHARRADTWPGTPVACAPDWAEALAVDLAERPAAYRTAAPSEAAPSGTATEVAPIPAQRSAPDVDLSGFATPEYRRFTPPDSELVPNLIKGLVALAATAAILTAGPDRIAAVLRPLITAVTPSSTISAPAPTGSAGPTLPAHTIGTACAVANQQARSARDGRLIRCLPLAANGSLHWQRPSSTPTSPTSARRPGPSTQR